MGKNRNRESLIRLIINTIAHQIVAKHTNRPESVTFLNSEIIEYRSQAEKIAQEYNWNDDDIEYVKEKSFKEIKDKLNLKYFDVTFSDEEINLELEEMIKKVLLL